MEDQKELIEAAFESFVMGARDKVQTHHRERFPMLDIPELTYTKGRRYWKLIRGSGGQRSSYCFVDRTNGDILKCATWSAPAKHARGNVLDDDNGMSAITEYGAVYLK